MSWMTLGMTSAKHRWLEVSVPAVAPYQELVIYDPKQHWIPWLFCGGRHSIHPEIWGGGLSVSIYSGWLRCCWCRRTSEQSCIEGEATFMEVFQSISRSRLVLWLDTLSRIEKKLLDNVIPDVILGRLTFAFLKINLALYIPSEWKTRPPFSPSHL